MAAGTTAIPSPTDPAGEPARDLDRYGWAVRRCAPLILAAGIVLGLLAATSLGSSRFTDTSRLSLRDGTEALASVSLAEAFEEIPPLFAVRDFFNNSALTSSLGGDASAVAIADTTTADVLVLTVDADSAAGRDEAARTVLAAADEFIGEQRAAAAAELSAVIAAQRTSTTDRLAQLDAEIARLGPNEALRDAYLDERAELNTQLLTLDGQERALAAYTGSGQRILVFESNTVQTDTRLTWFVVGFVLGALLSTIGVLVWAHLDRRVRNRSEMHLVAPGVTLPALPRDGAERQPALTAVASMSSRLAQGRLLVVPADDKAQAIATTVAGQIGDAAVVFSPRRDDPAAADGARAIVVAAAGRTHADDVSRTCSYLDALNCDVVGSLLGDVKKGQLRRAAA